MVEFTVHEREALEQAAQECLGAYDQDHLRAWDDLRRRGYVKEVTRGHRTFFTLTDPGELALQWVRQYPLTEATEKRAYNLMRQLQYVMACVRDAVSAPSEFEAVFHLKRLKNVYLRVASGKGVPEWFRDEVA